jgi:hypothetical protein
MPRLSPWRVRVKLMIETWVDVEALTAKAAEQEAAKLPNVISVFGNSATPANQEVEARQPVGIQEELF